MYARRGVWRRLGAHSPAFTEERTLRRRLRVPFSKVCYSCPLDMRDTSSRSYFPHKPKPNVINHTANDPRPIDQNHQRCRQAPPKKGHPAESHPVRGRRRTIEVRRQRKRQQHQALQQGGSRGGSGVDRRGGHPGGGYLGAGAGGAAQEDGGCLRDEDPEARPARGFSQGRPFCAWCCFALLCSFFTAFSSAGCSLARLHACLRLLALHAYLRKMPA